MTTGELIVTNGNHAQTIGEITGMERNYEYSLIDIFEKSEESVVQVNVLRGAFRRRNGIRICLFR